MTAPAASTVAAPDEAVRLADDEEISAVEEQLRLLFVRARSVWKEAAESVHPDLQPVGYKILSAIVYIADMKRKTEMNRAWDEWVDMKNPPMRACLGVELEPPHIVEIVVTAAK